MKRTIEGPPSGGPSIERSRAGEHSPTANTAIETMFGFLPQPAYMPCPECGVSLSREERDGHVCDAAQRARYTLFQLRGEIERFELELAGWLQSVNGRFEVFYAAWQRTHP